MIIASGSIAVSLGRQKNESRIFFLIFKQKRPLTIFASAVFYNICHKVLQFFEPFHSQLFKTGCYDAHYLSTPLFVQISCAVCDIDWV